MSWSGTVRCSYCYTRGHNQRGCPEIKANAEKVIAAARAAGIDPFEYKVVWNAYSAKKIGSEEISCTDMWAYDKHLEKRQSAAKHRSCSWCKETGHNKRSCQRRKDDMVRLRQALAFQHKLVQVFAEAKGLVPGNLLKYKQPDVSDDAGVMMLIEGISYYDLDFYLDRMVTVNDANDVDALLAQARMYSLDTAAVNVRMPNGNRESIAMDSLHAIRHSWIKPVRYQFYPSVGKAPATGSLISELKQETVDRYKADCGVTLYGRFSYNDRDPEFKAVADEFLEIVQCVSAN